MTPRQGRRLTLLSALAAGALVLLAASLFAADEPIPAPAGYVTDAAGVMGEWAARTETLCRDVERRSGAEIAVLTVRTRAGQSSRAAASPITVSGSPSAVTNRIFSVTFTFGARQMMLGATDIQVRPLLMAAGKQVGATPAGTQLVTRRPTHRLRRRGLCHTDRSRPMPSSGRGRGH